MIVRRSAGAGASGASPRELSPRASQAWMHQAPLPPQQKLFPSPATRRPTRPHWRHTPAASPDSPTPSTLTQASCTALAGCTAPGDARAQRWHTQRTWPAGLTHATARKRSFVRQALGVQRQCSIPPAFCTRCERARGHGRRLWCAVWGARCGTDTSNSGSRPKSQSAVLTAFRGCWQCTCAALSRPLPRTSAAASSLRVRLLLCALCSHKQLRRVHDTTRRSHAAHCCVADCQEPCDREGTALAVQCSVHCLRPP